MPLDTALCDRFLNLLFNKCSLGDIIVCRYSPTGRPVVQEVGNASNIAALVAKLAARGDDKDLVYKTSTIDWATAFARSKFAVGKSDEVREVTCFHLDCDTSSKDPKYPDRHDVINVLLAYKHPPSLLVSSGSGGVHAYWVLNTPVMIQDDMHYQQVEAVCRALQHDVSQCISLFGQIDVLPGLERFLRLPGASHKNGNRVTLDLDSGRRYDLADFGALPPVQAKLSMSRLSVDDEASCLVRYAREVRGLDTIEDYLAGVMGWSECSNGWVRSDGATGGRSGFVSDGNLVVTSGGVAKLKATQRYSMRHLIARWEFYQQWEPDRNKYDQRLGVLEDMHRDLLVMAGRPYVNDLDPWIVTAEIDGGKLPPPKQKPANKDQRTRARKLIVSRLEDTKRKLDLVCRSCVQHGLSDRQAIRLARDIEQCLPLGNGSGLVTDDQILAKLREIERREKNRGELARPSSEIDSTRDPDILAEKILREYDWDYDDPSRAKLRYWRGDFYTWDGCYAKKSNDDVKAKTLKVIQRELTRANRGLLDAWEQEPKKKPKPPSLKLTRALITDVLDCVKAHVKLPDDVEAPMITHGGIDGLKDTSEAVVFKNGLLNVESGRLLPLNTRLFNLNKLSFKYDPQAICPLWEQFVAEILGHDKESINLLREWFGLNLISDTRIQKILFLIGPPRSGKGTTSRILTDLLGKDNVAVPVLNQLTQHNGLAALVGKSAWIVGDSRVSGTMGEKEAVVQRLLGISGDDEQNVSRKYKEDQKYRLTCRITIMANYNNVLPDPTGALASRSLYLRTVKSHTDKEDLDLVQKLKTELPGIFNWALAGLRDLRQYGMFQQPRCAQDLVQQANSLASPIHEFIEDCCVVDDSLSAAKTEVYQAATAWYGMHGTNIPPSNIFSRDLCAATANKVRVAKKDLLEQQPDGTWVLRQEQKVYAGIGLTGARFKPAHP